MGWDPICRSFLTEDCAFQAPAAYLVVYNNRMGQSHLISRTTFISKLIIFGL